MRISTIAKHLASAVEATVLLESEGCLHAYDRFSECDACFQVCPAAAIQLNGAPSLDEELCQDCRACLAVCPTGACMYTGIDVVDALLYNADVMGVKTFELFCELNQNTALAVTGAQAGIRVRGCLAGIGVAAYLNLVGQGADKIILRMDQCRDCFWKCLPEYVTSQISLVKTILARWGLEERVTVAVSQDLVKDKKRPVWHAESPPRSRRSLFRVSDVQGRASTAPGEDGTRLYRERLRFIRALRLLVGQAPLQDVSLAGMHYGRLSVSDECTACETCARACPTEAISFKSSADSFTLSHSPQFCLGCEVCTAVCAPAAIQVDREPSFEFVYASSENEILQEGELTICGRCRARFATREGKNLCPTCEFRRKNPFGSLFPKGLQQGRRDSGSNLKGKVSVMKVDPAVTREPDDGSS